MAVALPLPLPLLREDFLGDGEDEEDESPPLHLPSDSVFNFSALVLLPVLALAELFLSSSISRLLLFIKRKTQFSNSLSEPDQFAFKIT